MEARLAGTQATGVSGAASVLAGPLYDHRVSELHPLLLEWYDEHARDLPWRRTSATAWGVLVSELMLQQTPVARVLPVYTVWMERWPTPASLASAPVGDAIRAWGRLGYPRRATRLHGAATAITEQHAGVVPDSYDALRALPGVGDYTAAAVASFAYGARHVVLDTNVRRVLARTLSGTEYAPPSVTVAERRLAEGVLPVEDAPLWAVATMELGALVCTATNPTCSACPVADQCAWLLAGSPAHSGPPRRGQAWAGTDRQCRGRVMAVLRDADGPVHRSVLDAVWADEDQRERALSGLVTDGLIEQTGPDTYALPS